MFDYNEWLLIQFDFERDGFTFGKRCGSANFHIDQCEHEVYDDDPCSHEIPVLIMWLMKIEQSGIAIDTF